MTIKRRLFISNILMLIIPIVLSILTISMIVAALMRVVGQSTRHNFSEDDQFQQSALEINRNLDDWKKNDSTAEEIAAEIEKILKHPRRSNLNAFIFQDDDLSAFVGSGEVDSLVEYVMSEEKGSIFVVDTTAVYKVNCGKFNILLKSNNLEMVEDLVRDDYFEYIKNLSIFAFLLVVGIIIITNLFLTKFLIKRIVNPLEMLIYGFHQLRDGNLNYRIYYKGKDEFAQVCSDFNDMAQKLLEFVNARQKDEDNRKELIAGISHDLRTPLTSIKAYAEGIEKGVASTPELQKRYFNIIKAKTEDLERIVNQLFQYSKLDIGEYPFYVETIDIGKELLQFVDISEKEYKQKGLQLKLLENCSNAFIEADAVQLRNVFTNIFENSVKYKDKDNAAMNITCFADAHTVCIRMQDDGPGVPEDVVDQLFKVFYRSDTARSNTSKGSGLGLAITERILMRFGGSVKAENGKDGGLVIIIRLPRVSKEEKS